MAKKLTTKSVENAKPGPQRREISDGGSGLYLILQPSGHRSWAVRYRANGEPTLPTRLDRELETNPFLRPHVTAIRAILGMPYAPDWKVFAAIRERKNKS